MIAKNPTTPQAHRYTTCEILMSENKRQFETVTVINYKSLEMWANAQRDGRPAEYRWRPLFNAAKFG